MPLPGLPAGDRRRIRRRLARARGGVASDEGATALSFHAELGGRANTNVASALTAVRDSPAENRMNGPPALLELPPAVWMIQAGFARNWIFSFRTYNRGTKWTRRFRSMISIRQCLRTPRAIG